MPELRQLKSSKAAFLHPSKLPMERQVKAVIDAEGATDDEMRVSINLFKSCSPILSHVSIEHLISRSSVSTVFGALTNSGYNL